MFLYNIGGHSWNCHIPTGVKPCGHKYFSAVKILWTRTWNIYGHKVFCNCYIDVTNPTELKSSGKNVSPQWNEDLEHFCHWVLVTVKLCQKNMSHSNNTPSPRFTAEKCYCCGTCFRSSLIKSRPRRGRLFILRISFLHFYLLLKLPTDSNPQSSWTSYYP